MTLVGSEPGLHALAWRFEQTVHSLGQYTTGLRISRTGGRKFIPHLVTKEHDLRLEGTHSVGTLFQLVHAPFQSFHP